MVVNHSEFGGVRSIDFQTSARPGRRWATRRSDVAEVAEEAPGVVAVRPARGCWSDVVDALGRALVAAAEQL